MSVTLFDSIQKMDDFKVRKFKMSARTKQIVTSLSSCRESLTLYYRDRGEKQKNVPEIHGRREKRFHWV